MEIYFGVTCSGAVLHTVNPRLFPEQVRFILDDAEVKLCVLRRNVRRRWSNNSRRNYPSVRGYVASVHARRAAVDRCAKPAGYEDLLAAESDDYAWPLFDENLASALCYTSGTTGNPKGVLQSHRSAVLHSFCADGSRHHGDLGAEFAVALRAAIPCELLGHSVRCRRHRRQDGAARHEDGWRQPV